MALIDTGASITAVAPAIVDELDAQAIGEVEIGRVDGSTERARTFYLSLSNFPGAAEAIGVEVVAATPASPCDVLIGRDLLGRWLMVYDGIGDSLVISY